MHRKTLLIAPALLLCLLLALLSFSLGTAPQTVHATEAADEHPEMEPRETCDGCHQDVTPDEYQAWFTGKHGLNNVKCFVCHGAVGANFAARPSQIRCLGCHSEKLESMKTSFMEGKDCFSCHPPHALSPHLASEEGARP